MIDEISQLMDRYAHWVRDKTIIKDVGDGYVGITTPYVDRHNDYIQFYLKKENGSFVLTDGGETIQDLRLCGCEIESKKRRDILTMTLNGFGVKQDGDVLSIRSSAFDFPLKKHCFVQAILAVNDLFFLAGHVVSSLFLEDVTNWLRARDIRFTPNAKFTGKSGYDHAFDFVIPASRKGPERFMRAVNKPARDIAEAMAFAWIDTKETRDPNSQFYALLNDVEKAPSGSVKEALRNYGIIPVLWGERESVAEHLAA